MLDLSDARAHMVRTQIAARGVRDPAVLEAMRSVPREAFLPSELEEFAYADTPLPIERGQTISQPYIVALMAAAAQLRPGDRVLEVGTGSGYAAAILGRIAREVYTVERHEELARVAAQRLTGLGFANVSAMARSAGRSVPRTTPSWWPRGARRCRRRSWTSSLPGVAW
jgi:protein-L-isoaspartate(D-aspartate) O-methyltransferase